MGEVNLDKKCPLCGYEKSRKLFVWEDMPINGNAIFYNENDALKCTKERLQMNICDKCGFVYNPYYNSEYADELYNRNYSVDRFHSSVYLNYLGEVIKLINGQEYEIDTIVDVGCGDEHFLSYYLGQTPDCKRALGYDPSIQNSCKKGNVELVKDYYSEKYYGDNADLITCRQVIEHIENPATLMEPIGNIGKRRKTLLYIETPNIEYILKNNIFDFYYEHCSYYSEKTLTFLLSKYGFEVIEMKKLLGGQYLNCVAVSPKDTVHEILEKKQIDKKTETYSDTVVEASLRIERFLSETKRAGKIICAWGAAAKGMTYANLFDKNREYFKFFVDGNQKKRNSYIPGTAHKIVGIEDLSTINPNILFLTNAAYKKDVLQNKCIKEYSVVTAEDIISGRL